MKTASIIINSAMFAITLILLAMDFRVEGRWVFRRGVKAFRYFTVLSNVFCGLAGLGMALTQMAGAAPAPVLMVKYMATVSVTVTLLTVFLFLAPTQGGFGELLGGRNLYMHLLGPLMAIGSFCLLEKREMSLPACLLGALPVLAYGALYLYRVIYAPEERRWEDFYGFNRGGKWPVAFGAMIAGTLAVCLIFWRVPPAVVL